MDHTQEDETTPMTPDEAVAALHAISGRDPVSAHAKADRILEAAVDPRVAEAYRRLIDRSDGWWFE